MAKNSPRKLTTPETKPESEAISSDANLAVVQTSMPPATQMEIMTQTPDRGSDCRSSDNDRPDDKPPAEGELPPIELYPRRVYVKGREERYTPFLVLRYAAGDTGGRPLPGGTVFWHSPDVWVRSSQGINQPVAGEANRMFARINNRGRMDAGWVHVRFWWANPSLAITEANAHLVGTADISVPSGQSRVVECPTPWVPVIENGGHECILTEAWAPELDPLIAPLEPVTDRHVGQKNLHVIQVVSGASFRFILEAMNISPSKQQVLVHARALTGEEAVRNLTAPDIGLSKRQLTAAPRPAPMRLDMAAQGTFPMSTQTTYARRLLARQAAAAHHPQEQCQPIGGVVITETLEAGELRTVKISGRVPGGARPGEAFGYEIIQRVGDMVTGGYNVYVVVVENTQGVCPGR